MDMTIEAKKRDTKVKASTLRKDGQVPGCIYGRGIDTLAIQIPFSALKACISKKASKLKVNVAGVGMFNVGIEEIQKGHMSSGLLHISLHAFNNNEMTTLSVPVEYVGSSKGSLEGGVVKEQLHEITVKGYPQNLPDKVAVDVSQLMLGETIRVSDLKHAGYTFLSEDLERVLCSCSFPKLQAVEETTTVGAVDPAATPLTTEETDTPAANANEKKAA